MNMNIGQTIKRLRQQKDMTQEQLAQLLCVSSAAVSKWEVGNTDLLTHWQKKLK